eukprot:Plantae.Rhodophyta-Hildenbrandia_rubra.ctg14389.p1 GENE.Plantae.Rhodophyta-Hildenbrandia_rubra.ctg14389~~Plantae.Rhodophyta-Hildenbrandia_rubra.ctg14389.p1  ORF type:complete len:430 (-),score=58.84 Plantae.Rhodophyta-Hildenbrandia_rubra.ctg14389:630-1919(-)
MASEVSNDKDAKVDESSLLLDDHNHALPHGHSHSRSPTSSIFKLSSQGGSELRTLIIASTLCFVFFLIELIGGYIAHSLAIMADAAHLLSDLAGFVISILAIIVSHLPANASLTYGFARAEVLGAFVSILLIWVLTSILVVFAFERLFNPVEVNGALMLLLGFIGLGVNLGMGLVLGHSHRESSHSHAHDLANHSQLYHEEPNQSSKSSAEEKDPESGLAEAPSQSNQASNDNNTLGDKLKNGKARVEKFLHEIVGHDIHSVNVRAAYLHVLGDALQNIGVIVAAVVIMLVPSWSFVDPLCTILFAVIVISTTQKLARETLTVLMEGTPEGCNISEIYNALMKLDGVKSVGDLHVWSITTRRPSLSVHIWANGKISEHEMLKCAQKELGSRFKIFHSTIQVNCEVNECCDSEENDEECAKQCVPSSQLS